MAKAIACLSSYQRILITIQMHQERYVTSRNDDERVILYRLDIHRCGSTDLTTHLPTHTHRASVGCWSRGQASLILVINHLIHQGNVYLDIISSAVASPSFHAVIHQLILISLLHRTPPRSSSYSSTSESPQSRWEQQWRPMPY